MAGRGKEGGMNLTAGRGMVRCGWAWLCVAWLGVARRGLAWQGRWYDFKRRGEEWPGEAWLG